MKNYVLIACCCLLHLAAFNQAASKKYFSIHSHNDYEQPIPFWNAYKVNAGSIEVDIYLEDGKILVGHDKKDLKADRTIQALYLDPILKVVKEKQGIMETDNQYMLQLLIDIKSPTNPCLDTLVAILERYPEIINHPRILFVLSGNKPPVKDFGNYPAFILYDGLPWEDYSTAIINRVPLLSANLQRYTKWRGEGAIPEADKKALQQVISATHQKGKKIRFWNAPDHPAAWKELEALGVDYMNTDHLEKLFEYMQ